MQVARIISCPTRATTPLGRLLQQTQQLDTVRPTCFANPVLVPLAVRGLMPGVTKTKKAPARQKTELETAQNAAKETLASLETANAGNTELSAKLETLTAENEALTKERDEAKIEAAKAREQGARYGAKAPAGGTASNGPKEFTTSAQIKEHYATLTGEERFAFFQKNKKTLLS